MSRWQRRHWLVLGLIVALLTVGALLVWDSICFRVQRSLERGDTWMRYNEIRNPRFSLFGELTIATVEWDRDVVDLVSVQTIDCITYYDPAGEVVAQHVRNTVTNKPSRPDKSGTTVVAPPWLREPWSASEVRAAVRQGQRYVELDASRE